jgi:hypothetical protein
MKILVLILAAFIFFSVDATAQQRPLSGYLIRDRVAANTTYKISRCEVAYNQQDMEAKLRAVSWPLGQSVPRVNWTDELVIIIAPAGEDPAFSIYFDRVTWMGNEFILHWGWWDGKKYRKTTMSRGSWTTTFGQRASKHQVLVAIIKSYVNKQYKIFCTEHTSL